MTKLLANGQATNDARNAGLDTPDHAPVVKLFNSCGAATWLISEIDPTEPDIAFGLCDLGFGCPELGSVSLSEITELRRFGRPCVERDMYTKLDKSMSAYCDEAREAGRIVV